MTSGQMGDSYGQVVTMEGRQSEKEREREQKRERDSAIGND